MDRVRVSFTTIHREGTGHPSFDEEHTPRTREEQASARPSSYGERSKTAVAIMDFGAAHCDNREYGQDTQLRRASSLRNGDQHSSSVRKRQGPRLKLLCSALSLVCLLGFLPSVCANSHCALCQTSLTFTDPEAGSAVPITVQFRFGHTFVQGDRVIVKLPDFSRSLGSTTSFAQAVAYDGSGTPSPAFSAASWDEPSKLLTLHHINPLMIVADTLLRVTVLKNALLRLPSNGSRTNRTDLEIRALAAAATTDFEQFQQTEPVGVLYNTSVAFDPALPLTAVAVSLNFTTSIAIGAGENASLELDQFTVASSSVVACNVTICSNLWGLDRSCSNGTMQVEVAKRSASVIVYLMFSDSVLDSEQLSMTIPRSAGIVTPAESQRNNPAILMGSQSSAGPVRPSPVEVSNEIPRYSISYRPAIASTGECSQVDVATGFCTGWQSEKVNIDINVVLDLQAALNDELVLTLPGFSRRTSRQGASVSTSSIVRQECPGGGCDANVTLTSATSETVYVVIWEEEMQKLRLAFSGNSTQYPLAVDSLVSTTIPNSFGLHVPVYGTSINDASITLQHVTSVSTDPRSVTSPPVGAFTSNYSGSFYSSPKLSFAASSAGGTPIDANFTFASFSPFSTSQCIGYCGTNDGTPLPFSVDRRVMGPVTVSLTLPGFTRAGGNLDHFEIAGTPAFAHASWVEASNTLLLTSTAQTDGSTAISISLPQHVGIFHPTAGVTRNSVDLKIESNSQSGPVLKTAIGETAAVGGIADATISFSPAKAGIPVQMTLTFIHSQDMDAREYFTMILPGFTRRKDLPSTIDLSTTVDGIVRPLFGEWIGSGENPVLKMIVGGGGIQANTKIRVIVSRSNQIYFRETGTPIVGARNYWRVVNNSAVRAGWSIADVVLYSDPACRTRIAAPGPSSTLGSSGAGIVQTMECDDLVYAPPTNSTVACPSGYRLARRAEISGCKLALCDVGTQPEFLVAQGDGAYVLGAGYGCKVVKGKASIKSADAICVPQEAAAYNVFDGQSSSSWLQFAATSEMYVGAKFDSKVSAHCALVEQERFDSNWTVASLAIQSSPDGVQWATVIEGSVGKGANLLRRPKGIAFESITLASFGARGPCQDVQMSAAPVGAFRISSLSYGTPVAGSASNITITIVPEMEIDIGETITVKLNGFEGDSSDSLSLVAHFQQPILARRNYSFVERTSYNPRSAGPAPACANSGNATSNCSNVSVVEFPLFNATWAGDSFTLKITCGAVIYAGQKLSVTILESNNVRLPASGITASSCGTGPMVGPLSLLSSSGSTEPCGTCEGCVGVNENTITISCNAHTGPVADSPATVLRQVQRIGRFFNTSVTFSALTAAYPVNVSVQFSYSFELQRDDEVYLHLADFKGLSAANVATIGPQASALGKAKWNAATGILTLTVTNTSIAALTRLAVTVPASANVILRSDGFVRNSPLLQMSSNAINGPVHRAPIESSPAMGSFNTGEPSRISYTPAEFKADGTAYLEGRVSAITVGFALNRKISVGEHVVLGLTGFSRDAGDAPSGFNASAFDGNISTVDTNGVFSSFMTASWTESSQRLTLTASQDILPDQRHIVLIPSSAMLRLPKVGLRQNDARLTIGTNAVDGPNAGTPIQQSPALNEVCGAECGAWAFTCGACKCGPCA